MVVNFTLGKAKYAVYEEELRSILEQSEKLRSEFLNLVDLDVIAYQSKNIREALDVPFMISKLCFETIKLCYPLVKKGNVNLISDVAVAAVLLEAAFTSACFNVEINLRSMEDKKIVKEIRKELGEKEKSVQKIRVKTEEEVGKIIRR